LVEKEEKVEADKLADEQATSKKHNLVELLLKGLNFTGELQVKPKEGDKVDEGLRDFVWHAEIIKQL